MSTSSASSPQKTGCGSWRSIATTSLRGPPRCRVEGRGGTVGPPDRQASMCAPTAAPGVTEGGAPMITDDGQALRRILLAPRPRRPLAYSSRVGEVIKERPPAVRHRDCAVRDPPATARIQKPNASRARTAGLVLTADLSPRRSRRVGSMITGGSGSPRLSDTTCIRPCLTSDYCRGHGGRWLAVGSEPHRIRQPTWRAAPRPIRPGRGTGQDPAIRGRDHLDR